MPAPWQRELAAIFTPMRWRLDLYWNEVHRDSMLPPELVTEFADWLLSGDTAKVRGHFDSDFPIRITEETRAPRVPRLSDPAETSPSTTLPPEFQW